MIATRESILRRRHRKRIQRCYQERPDRAEVVFAFGELSRAVDAEFFAIDPVLARMLTGLCSARLAYEMERLSGPNNRK